MKTRRIPRLLLLISLIAIAAFLMGGGTECPKRCIIKDAACAPRCGDPANGTCVEQSPGGPLFCEGGGDDEDEPER